MTAIEVFISYHQKDEELCEELEKHLATLLREQTITSWHNREIVAGQEFQAEINKYLKRAGLILLLVSPDFLASDYHWTVEVTRALEQNAAGKARVIPVLLRHADWDNPPIDKLSPLPSNRKPIKSWVDRDEAFLEVVKGIRQEVARLVASSNYSPPQEISQELEKCQDQVTRLINEADRLLKDEKLEEAAFKYKAALRLEPNSVLAQNILVFVLHKLGKLEEAIATYDKALRLNPNFATAHYNLANVLFDKLEKAIAVYQRATAKDNKAILAMLAAYEKATYLEKNAIAQINLGLALFNQGKLEEAITAYQETMYLEKEAITAYQEVLYLEEEAVFHIQQRLALFNQDKLKEAITEYQKALYLCALNNLGLSLFNQGKLEEAIMSYEKALRLNSNFATVYNNLGNVLFMQGKLEEAITSYEKALRLDPKFATSHNNLGFALFIQGKLEEAITAYEKALRFNPDSTKTHNNLGLALSKQEKLEEAIASYQTALYLDPNNTDAQQNLGIALFKQGKLKEGIAKLGVGIWKELFN
ncbi:tetratricopeptide repeat protein [Aliinostoc sp. HNIBRCY26]|uniref:toll/interleukin-1 receptor domain-containing protein n=1 Tax=Aliinostoc sp. HNIBRCY26 TaxID=3418997 RepID=UPI003D069C5A